MTSGARPSPSPEAVRALAATDRLEEAGALLAELVRAEPRLGRERLPLALLAVEVGRADLALAQLEAAAAEASDDPAIAAELTSLRAELALAERVPSPPTRPSSSDQEPPPQAVEDPFGGTFSDDATARACTPASGSRQRGRHGCARATRRSTSRSRPLSFGPISRAA